MKESRKKLLKGIVTAAAAAGAVYGMNRLVFFLSTMKDLLTSKKSLIITGGLVIYIMQEKVKDALFYCCIS